MGEADAGDFQVLSADLLPEGFHKKFTDVVGIKDEHAVQSLFACSRHSRPSFSALRESSSSGIAPTVCRHDLARGLRPRT